jgi:hypothetical protein
MDMFLRVLFAMPVRALRTKSHLMVTRYCMALQEDHWWLLLAHACFWDTDRERAVSVFANHADTYPPGHRRAGCWKPDSGDGFNRVSHRLLARWCATTGPNRLASHLNEWIEERPVAGPAPAPAGWLQEEAFWTDGVDGVLLDPVEQNGYNAILEDLLLFSEAFAGASESAVVPAAAAASSQE